MECPKCGASVYVAEEVLTASDSSVVVSLRCDCGAEGSATVMLSDLRNVDWDGADADADED